MAQGKMPSVKSQGPLVCLLTDFGETDSYVGVMKGVLMSVAPEAKVVDLSHGIAPQDVRAGAFQLLSSFRHFPKETMFVCVVDPGVGSARKIIYMEAGSWRFVGPDNGLLSWVAAEVKPKLIIDIDFKKFARKKISKTFHGRDIIAPLAGRLMNGEPPEGFGRRMKSLVKLPFPRPFKSGARWTGEIIAVDRYGNLVTNIRSDDVSTLTSGAKIWMELGKQKNTIRGLSESYTAVDPGKFLAIEGSAGFLEISVRDGNAKKKSGMDVGSPVVLNFRT